MSSQSSNCATCGATATARCSGCFDAPEYSPGDATPTTYCSCACQKANWQIHKAHCHAMRRRRTLLRAAQLLKTTLLTYREVVFDLDLTKIELKDGVLCLHQTPNLVPRRGPYPEHLTTNREHREAALMNNQCTTAMALLGRLTKILLADVAFSIELVDLQISKPLRRTKLIPGVDSENCPHTVLKVRRLFADETWILDTTGCQYGFRDVLVPYDKYIAEKESRVVGVTTYDANETKDLDYFATLPFMNMVKMQREGREVEKKARLHFAKFVDTQVNKGVLTGSLKEFREKRENFAEKLRVHMLHFWEQI